MEDAKSDAEKTWECPQCEHINGETTANCALCNTAQPTDASIPPTAQFSTVVVDQHLGEPKSPNKPPAWRRRARGDDGCWASFTDWANPFVGDQYELRKGHICVWIVVCVLTIVFAPMLAESFERVMFDEYGIGYSTISGEIDTEITGSGRHFVGIARDFHRLPKQIATIDFSTSGGTAPMTLRVKNGQQIEADISFQFKLPESKVFALYTDFKFGYASNFRKTAESSFRLVAAKYHAEEFFHNRTQIEADMQAALREKIEERHAELVGLQVRAIDLPDSFESRLVEIELKKQDAQKATEEILLAQINAETQKQLRELIAAKDKLRIQLEQETENLRLHILQNETEIKEGTSRLLAALNAEKEEFLVLWAQETENLELEVLHNKTIIDQQTNAEVAELDARTAEYIQLFTQETTNLQLGVLQNKTLEEERTTQAVALINAEKAAFKDLFQQTTENLVAELEANITQVLQATSDALLALDTDGQLVTATATANIDKLLASAKADAAVTIASARTEAAHNDAEVSAGVQKAFAASLTGESQLLYSWIKAFESTAATEDGGLRYMDLATPTALTFSSNASATATVSA